MVGIWFRETTADWCTYVGMIFTVYPKDRDSPCHLCNLTNDHHALSLSVTAPIVDYQTNMIKSFPVISCLRACGMDSVEADVPLRVRRHLTRRPFQLHKTVVLTIPKLNAEYGFDPGREGADVCEHFGWPLLQILDPSTGEWTSNGAASQSSGPAPVVSDNTPDQTLNEEPDSIPCGTDVAMGNIKEAQAGEAPTKTEIVPVVQHDISTRLLIVIFIAIGIQVILTLSSFHNYL
ncbi:uncharacterized protein BT62DRAFT_937125 [Guyanagaster necrorhizus]|uniref:Uncharacterized protein n=2 Tax=Guyanagaster necrorhizus TaxID=856835 RepID=A0A9P8AML1_9AGAR|nr:uncharacterized protein BT62DRAFT_937125 [Guyanagaster necrorhizus MCA 3950]KAG7441363.1 hypothetical protein BT62DRAFT_937125 [Guyanagaster necrorhizus MCA 3950]